ncbi:MAG: Ig-like domain-containing protein [Candidatus Sericytochromatia bacterium]|nr:Ig-like domain-containing protein [Candidatus Sericytochromatia bacterium]
MTVTRQFQAVSALAVALIVSGCGYSPLYQPLPMQPYTSDYVGGNRLIRQEVIPTLPAGVEATALELEPGQASARVGQSMQLTAVIRGSDNKLYRDPRLVTWAVGNSEMAQIDRQGVLMPTAPGTVKAVAQVGKLTAEATIQVEPARYAWQQVLSPTGVNLRAVKMVSRFEAWAGGENGTLLRFVNGAWRAEPSFRQPDASITGLGFANSTLGWAVGSRAGGSIPFAARWDGNAWRQVNLPVSAGTLQAISVINERDAWAVGQEAGGNGLLLHWDGASWRQAESPARGKINDIHMVSARSGWAVGKYSGLATTPMILKYQDGAWVKKSIWDNRGAISVTDSQELTAIKMISETQGYAVGIRDNLVIRPRGIFLQYDPKRDGWVSGQFDSSVEGLDQVPLHDIEMISGTEGWALGQVRQRDFTLERNPRSIFGNLLANQNGVLKPDTSYFSGNVSGAFYAIDLLPQGEGFVVGQNGVIMQRTFDWRGLNNGTGSSAFGGGQSSSLPLTYGPGGVAVPGGTPVNNF